MAFLVLANAGYFLWAHGVAGPGEEQPAAPMTTVLRLASEAPQAVQTTPVVARSGEAGASGVPGDASRGEGSAELVSDAKRCVTVGPFREGPDAAHAATTLRNVGYDPRQRVEAEAKGGVWVFLPIPPGRGENEQLMGRLKTAGVGDALEMPGPGDVPVISLGLYDDARRGQVRVTQVQALGFKPSVVDRKQRTGSFYWLDVDLKPTEATLNPADLQGAAGHAAHLEVKSCPPGEGTR